MIEPVLADALKVVKERDGIPEGEQIRRALAAWFAEKGVTLKLPVVARGKSARKRAGTRKRA